MESQFNAGCAKPLPLDKTFLIDNQTALSHELLVNEFEHYESVQNFLRQLISIKSETHEKPDFAELHSYSWYFYYARTLLSKRNISEASEIMKKLEKMPDNHLIYFLKFLHAREVLEKKLK